MILLMRIEFGTLWILAVTAIPMLLVIESQCLAEWQAERRRKHKYALIHAELDRLSPTNPSYWEKLLLLAEDHQQSN